MNRFSATSKALLASGTLMVFGAAVVFSGGTAPNAQPGTEEKKAGPTDHIMFGGTLDRNMVNTKDRGVPDKVDPEGPDVLWKAALGSRAYGGPIIAAGKIVCGTNNEQPRNKRDVGKDGEPIDRGVVMCFDEKTGKFLWQAVHEKLPAGQVNDWEKEGVCSTASVEGDRIYYVSNRCTVVCADANGMANGMQGKPLSFLDKATKKMVEFKDPSDADIIWEVDMIKELNVFPHNMSAGSPLIVGDILFLVTANGVDAQHLNIPSPEAPSFLALDKKTGKVLWKSNAPGRNIMHGQWSNPVYAEIEGVKQVIFPGGDGWLYSFVPESGELIWKFDCNPKDAVYELGGTGTRNDFIGTPIVYDSKVYIGIGQDPEHSTGIAHFYCIGPKKDKKGDVSKTLVDGYKKPGEPINERPNPNSCEVWRYGGIEDRPNAPRDFKFGRTMSTACIVDDIVYIAELSGFLHCLDAKTGKHFWQYDTKASIWGSAYYVDGKVLLANDQGDLFTFKHLKKQEVYDEVAAGATAATPKAAREEHKKVRAAVEKAYLLSKVELDAPVRSTPVVSNGVLYVMTEKTLYAFKCGK
ncbi:Pyrrolo-quinoline quinone repeat-containing protein OS=Planctomyces brasiliensis (strain ATCC 49424 / DSM 5305 / JCM 21570 / NBRC 103401 / IFAM 1448) GN=Plabr_1285 PE=4 SV=1: PQQ_2: PQQ_2 [Gemmataceae bacterium]|nr:Pyrrolo-quinoline quinone repeat-containing protein OS=Planctomyces brasiliensis (strain ATCC 49424 / DSM 5305 / JCM 21570 / NBRC 103401 / IFAM 1448) GN=Plabr_1285 PE=4 SV=1: PQQ_2: PQQ_2 [Gemmataceae bacterium]VTT96967.1 Pyrrolo-quinoline quinone repeat-containing protein OS=Planctomyces brasiliensis (strain ATCC 49424 / DSM 5305 / JCM 21570 / NBRC 103401 / IFAM 1448) GN=Plabr_1285 PE=4 SV=1: PQQ_2: PQQ_2 [Gemmataceae bacterium]